VSKASLRAFVRHDPSLPVAIVAFDSLVDDPRSLAGQPRWLLFVLGRTRVELRVTEASGRRLVHLELTPPSMVEVSLLSMRPSSGARTDELGCASLSLAPGLMSLVACDPQRGRRFRTAWMIV